jgi:hypothetical protein
VIGGLGITLIVFLAGSALAQRLPVPPIPPANPPPRDLAPVPNKQIEPPSERRDGIVLRPEFYPATRPDPSQGFAPGSRYQTQDEQRAINAPGLRLIVPLR